MKTTENNGVIDPSIGISLPFRVIEDYAFSAGIASTEAVEHAAELEKFLYLCFRDGGPWIPSPIVDSIWHEFILHTFEYQEYCRQRFDRFIHHVPRRGVAGDFCADYLRTIATLRETYGNVNESIWEQSATYLSNLCSGGGGGGGGR